LIGRSERLAKIRDTAGGPSRKVLGGERKGKGGNARFNSRVVRKGVLLQLWGGGESGRSWEPVSSEEREPRLGGGGGGTSGENLRGFRWAEGQASNRRKSWTKNCAGEPENFRKSSLRVGQKPRKFWGRGVSPPQG